VLLNSKRLILLRLAKALKERRLADFPRDLNHVLNSETSVAPAVHLSPIEIREEDKYQLP